MAYRVGGTIRRTSTGRGIAYAIRFAHGDLKWTHRVGGSWEGWTEEKVQFERERLSILIERGEYVNRTPAPVRPLPAATRGTLTLPVAAAGFLERQRMRARADKTAADLEWRLRHLVGFFGDVALDELWPARFEEFQLAKLQERQAIEEANAAGEPLLEEYEDTRGRTCRRKRRGIDRAQINRILATLDRLLTDAARRGDIDAHPASGFAREVRLVVRSRPRSFLELDQADALLRAARELESVHRGLTWEKVALIRSSPLSNVALARELGVSDVLVGKVRRRLIWVERSERPNRNDIPRTAIVGTLLLFGLRVEELCALDAGDVDFARGVLRVRDLDDHATKTAAGHRLIPMLPAASALLQEHVLSHPCGVDEPLFRTRTGRRQTQDNVRARILSSVVQRANELLAAEARAPIARCTPHTLRRTFASLLAEVGLPPRRAMRLLGQTDPTLTMTVYQQVLDMADGGERLFAQITGATLAEAFGLLSERQLQTILRPVTPETGSERPAPHRS